MTYAEALQEAKDTCKECLTFNDCVKEECMWHWIIKALEKQIPKKLIETEEFVEGSCQNCKRNIGWIKDEYFDFDNCPFCGQAIDWSDTE